MQRWFKRSSLLLILVLSPLASSVSVAGGETPIEIVEAKPELQLKPFKAYYQAQFDLGISLSGEVVRELKALPDGQWQLSMKASAIMARIDESSRFEISQQQLYPLHYSYQRKVFGKKKQRQQQFDWSAGNVLSSQTDRATTLPIDQNTHDKVSYQIQLWRDLDAGLSEMHYQLVDGDHLKQLDFLRIGEEIVDTPAGRFETIRVERDRGDNSARKTTLWFAKNLDHVIVKLQQIETDNKEYTLLLERIDTP